MNFVYISYEALDAYLLSQQDETLLGIDVQDFYDMEHSVGPNEYYTVGNGGGIVAHNINRELNKIIFRR